MQNPIDYIELGKEVAQHIPEPQTSMETWIFFLFAVAGWAVWGFTQWMGIKEKETEKEESKALVESVNALKDTMIEIKVYLQSRTEQDKRVEDLKEHILSVKSSISILDSKISQK